MVCPLLTPQTLTDLASLQPARQAGAGEVLDFIEREHLFGLSCGIVDMHLLASTLITQGARLWTLDKRLDLLAERFGVAHRIGAHWRGNLDLLTQQPARSSVAT